MKVYKVSKFRTNGQNFQDMHDPEIRTKNSEVGKYFLITEDDNLLSKDRNPENGVPFFGTWTDNFEEFKKDNTIELYCVVDNHSRICPHGNILDVETEERKHEIEGIIDNALTEEDCKAWAEGNLTDHVKELMEEHYIKQMNIWDDVCEIIEFDSQEKTYKYKAYFENKTCPVAVGAIDAESKEEAEKILFGISGSWTDESGNVFDAGCPVDVEVEKEADIKSKIAKIEEIVGIKFPTGLIDKSVRGVNNFIDVHVETEDKKIYSVNYIGNWDCLYLGHDYFMDRVPIKDIVAIHKNGSRYKV